MNNKDKFKLEKDMNLLYAQSNFTRLIHTTARFEGVTTTLSQTQTIIDGLRVSGVSLEDIAVIVTLKSGWNYITKGKKHLI
jgi:hypothetical protein